MKRQYLTLCLISMVGAGGWLATTLAQRNAPFDVEETRKELEILEGILSTTLKYAVGDSRQRAQRTAVLAWGRNQDIESFYLYGQGAVFMIPNSRSVASSRVAELDQVFDLIDQVEEKGSTTDTYLHTLERRIEGSRRGRAFGSIGGIKYLFPPAPPEAPEAPVASPVVEVPIIQGQVYSNMLDTLALSVGRRGKEVSGEELDEWIRTKRATLQRERREAKQAQAERDQREQKIQDAMISALAQHGDSLSAIGPNEYISLIFLNGSASFDAVIASSRGHAGALVTSVQMSQLTEFKRGGMTLGQLREKLIQYKL